MSRPRACGGCSDARDSASNDQDVDPAHPGMLRRSGRPTRPRAAWRLADRLLRASGPEQIQAIVNEFGDWHTEVEKLLNRNRATGGDAQLLSTRVTVWSGALLHGGQRRSVIKAADDLLTRLGLERNPVNVLTDATTSSRLDAAKITRDGDRAFHDTQKEGLPAAILRHLWDEFPTQHELLRRWAIGIAADRTVPEEDARLITTALWKLAAHRHDRAILDGLASDLKGPRRVLAVEALTNAAGDAEFGRYVRDRLRQWMDAKNPSPRTTRLTSSSRSAQAAGESNNRPSH
ncbi:hypothetical protein [Streptomyces sp. CA-251247]|uniref:hypothetical protein n=1 Tax=Streptomyces sp. CA-251247 TaxID=3240062 RepID=UPI003D8B44CC